MKVFSQKLYEKWANNQENHLLRTVAKSVSWPKKIDGMPDIVMEKMGVFIVDVWMVEIDDWKPYGDLS